MRVVCSRNRLIMSPADYQIQYSAYRGGVLASAARGLYPTCGPSLHVSPPPVAPSTSCFLSIFGCTYNIKP